MNNFHYGIAGEIYTKRKFGSGVLGKHSLALWLFSIIIVTIAQA